MNLNFGISTMVYHQENLLKLLPYLNNFGIKNIEIRPHPGHFQCQNPELIFKIKNNIKKYDINVVAIHMPMADVDISHIEEYDRVKSIREIEKTIITALNLDAKIVVVHPGNRYNNSNDKIKKLDNCVKSLKEITDYFYKSNIKIALKNTLPGRLGDRWEDIKRIMDEVSSEKLGVCLDTGHYILNEEYAKIHEFNLDILPIDWQRDLLHVHIHDNNYREDLHLLPGEGRISWSSLISYLKKIDYMGNLILESKKQEYLPDYFDKVNSVFKKMKKL